ncbi:hypothetical protein PTKU46_23340 [Paraburkholderia terrae]|uniref:Uncharacterized protein n=1 Tax=Paraburkholderia steynii TaxID=1245441 RepID=A0A7Z7BLN1_9BURK|nr:hypothetical protein SAMN04487926_15920 [Paraburkholderia steynii]
MSQETDLARRRLYKRAIMAYSGGAGMVLLALAISIHHGTGWRPALAGMPLYVTVFGGITYQFIKELRALNGKR